MREDMGFIYGALWQVLTEQNGLKIVRKVTKREIENEVFLEKIKTIFFEHKVDMDVDELKKY
ncbi:hypothetical protein AwErysi_03000 [Erysipelotrichaceae bacterium]|nr:hypothetical protein AwErysi_03000 [Erysipelotrichaceae bacterium]